MNQPQLDLVAVLVVLSGLLFSPAVAAVVAPYLVIFLGAFTGAFFALGRRAKESRLAGLSFFARVIGLALCITVPVAVFTAPYLGITQERYLFAPVAFAIGLIGDDWPRVAAWLVEFVWRWKKGGPGGSNG